MNSVVEFVKALGPARMGAMGAVAAALVGFFIFLMIRVSQPQMTVLFTELPFEDSTAIIKKLESMNVPFEMRQEGAVILVPKKHALRLRMKLAESGLPVGGGVGYEIFDKSDGLGATSFVQNINHLRAIEGELARTIRSLNRVIMARVHLVLPKRRLFSRKAAEPSASIVLKVRGSLDKGQIKAIQHLVASAVEGLKTQRVSIVDNTGKLLASGQNDGEEANFGSSADERKHAYEQRLQNAIEDIVASVVGAGKVRVRVAAELDYNKVTETSDIFDPDGQVVRSTNSTLEKSNSSQPGGDKSVSVGNELPAASGSSGSSGNIQENSDKSSEIVNYEISRTTRTEIIEAGRTKKISVAVLVDGLYAKDANGKLSYQPRPQNQLDEIERIVRSAIGFDGTRGDQVHISNLRFAASAVPALPEAESGGFLDFSKQDYFYIAELVVTLLVSLLVLLMVVRPLIRRIITPENKLEPSETAALANSGQAVADQQGGAIAQIPGPDGQPAMNPSGALAIQPPSNMTAEAIRAAKASGEMQASVIREVGEMVGNNPQEAIGIIRDWIHTDAEAY
ncbi:flagellar M-ring protein [bacterium MnTg02]|nr:flagellar M-ring protein [bacterium MnTg02]